MAFIRICRKGISRSLKKNMMQAIQLSSHPEEAAAVRTTKILTVVGARPNFMKAAPILSAMRDHNRRIASEPASEGAQAASVRVESVLVHTGQHYDEAMSDWFFADLNIPKPDIHLGVGSGSHAAQTADVMKKFEEVLLRESPDVMIVVGDVNSTLACSLVASKLACGPHRSRPLIAHVEAGLRSFDRCMPEEVNRIVTDHLADLLFVTEESGITNLRREGIAEQKIHFVGNTMIDSLLACRESAGRSPILDKLGLRTATNGHGNGAANYVLLTLHRPSNVDDRDGFLEILQGLDELAASCPVIFPAHPRTQKKIAEFGLDSYFRRLTGPEDCHSGSTEDRISLVDPLGYLDFLCLMQYARLVVTDSGGIQEETTSLGVPCVTVRDNTERPSTIEVGTNVLAGTSAAGIRAAAHAQLQRTKTGSVPELWDGQSAQRILNVVLQEVSQHRDA